MGARWGSAKGHHWDQKSREQPGRAGGRGRVQGRWPAAGPLGARSLAQGPPNAGVGTAPGSRRRAVSPTLTAVSSWTRELPHGEGLDVLPSASSGSQTGHVCVLWDRVGLFPERRCFSVPRARGGPVRVESECCSASSAGWARTRRRRRPHGERPVVGAVAGGGAVLPPAATETLRHGLWLRPCVCLQFLSDVW